ncbi:MAG: hypothetical protein JWP52_989 [Rhizobacter sp.]|nr:hypothetical protein [Rhizobacter sp.]
MNLATASLVSGPTVRATLPSAAMESDFSGARDTRRNSPRTRIVLSALMAAVLAGCAGLPQKSAKAPQADDVAAAVSAAAPAPAGSSPRAPGATTPPIPGALKPFAEVIKGADRVDGLFTLWRKDDKVWIELKPADLNQTLFLSPKYKTGIGEKGLYGGTMVQPWLVQFRRINNLVQLIALNTDFVAREGTPAARAVEAAFSPSLLGSSPVLSQPNAANGAVLIEANPIFVSDLLGTGMRLQRSYRQGYVLDARNSAITEVRGKPEMVVFEVLNHFATGTIATATSPTGSAPSVPESVPDPRSLFMTMHFSLAKLPETLMKPRRADARIGHFTSAVDDFSDDVARTPRQRIVNRWRLEKKDPQAALSEPVKPIEFWVDRTVPEKYRGAFMAGILEWNKAFEKIGFKNAIVAKIQPDDADFDTLDFGHASVRWMTNASPQFGAIGPRHVDPRTGEILDADIAIESLSSRAVRSLRSQVLAPLTSAQAAEAEAASGRNGHAGVLGMPGSASAMSAAYADCDYADQEAEQMNYALDVLEARGELEPGSEAAEKFVLAYLKDTTMHEVGHTLGLRHNFRASRAYTEQELADPAFTAEHGISGSVMEYSAINLAAPGALQSRQGMPFQNTLGPYDYWAIEYAYEPIAPEAETKTLAKIASRSNEPQLAYGTDEDNFLGIDPESLQFDLGSDVLAFARKRIAIAQDLLARQEKRELRPDQDYSVLRRSVNYALRDLARAGTALTRQIGGVRTLRDFPGSGRDPLVPVPASQQRQALDLLTTGILSADSFKLSASIQRKLAIDFQERWDAVLSDGTAAISTDYSLTAQALGVQRGLLSQLMSDAVATRLLDSEGKSSPRFAAAGADDSTPALRLSELYSRVTKAVWSELAGGDIPALRRDLQREYLNRMTGALLRPASSSRADARSLLRMQAQTLLKQIEVAEARPGLSGEAKAHLLDSADTLREALSAKLQRAGA